ncbi:MAG TPA: CopD family protein [Caulobacteraceae bacterium]|nr:CopD family protein [Caulobacteraceae bacterium]
MIYHYDLLRGLHILAVIALMSGLLYLPRLYVYHTRVEPGSQSDDMLQTMEVKLLRIIINPALFLVLLFGGLLIRVDLTRLGPGFLSRPWMLTKIVGILFLFGWHGFLARSRRAFAEGRNRHSERFWRMTNELPFLAAIIIVLAATTKFGG